MIAIDVQGMQDVLEAVSRMNGEEILKAARPGLQQGLGRIRDDARANCPEDTGELRERIRTRTRLKGGELVGEVIAGAPHSVYVEMGTGPRGEAQHAGVDPARAQRVTYSPKGWVYPTKDGGFRFTRGMPARPFLYPAYKANEARVQQDVARTVMRAAKGV